MRTQARLASTLRDSLSPLLAPGCLRVRAWSHTPGQGGSFEWPGQMGGQGTYGDQPEGLQKTGSGWQPAGLGQNMEPCCREVISNAPRGLEARPGRSHKRCFSRRHHRRWPTGGRRALGSAHLRTGPGLAAAAWPPTWLQRPRSGSNTRDRRDTGEGKPGRGEQNRRVRASQWLPLAPA